MIQKLTKHKKPLIILIAILLIVLIGVGTALVISRNNSDKLVPANIRQQISFIIYVPSPDWQTPPDDMLYTESVLGFASTQSGTSVSINEQATPDIFSEVPQYFPSLLDKLNRYASFDTANGTVYLTKPKELKGGQQAVLNSNGTLLFAHPNHPLTNDQWRRFFNTMQSVKPN
jgi:hypothetical protein